MGLLGKLFEKSQPLLPSSSGIWTTMIQEPFTGAWQLNKELKQEDLPVFFAVFSCTSKIAQDIAKLPIYTKIKKGDVWQQREIDRLSYLKKPNGYQTTQQFIESWVLSKLFHGNSYIFKQRDISGNITALHVLNPRMVKPLISDDGQVFYQLSKDNLNQTDNLVLPVSEIIHDRWNCFYHPLVGLPPVMACTIAAGNGLAIQRNSSAFFGNKSMPSGILIAPGHVSREIAEELAKRWNDSYSGDKAGKTAVLSDGMQYQQISMSAADSQLIEQLKLSAEIVCSAFKMPPFLIGFGSLPAGMKVSDLNELYYSGCLQAMIEAIETLLSGLVGDNIAVEFDLHSLIRMDAQSQMQILADGVKASVLTINEARANRDLPPVDGGDTPYMQQQNYSLAALAKRDARDNPFTPNSLSLNDNQAA